MIYLFYETDGGAKMARFNLAWVTEGKDWETFIEN
jgi:sialidase-1